jgi:hypothetical protein
VELDTSIRSSDASYRRPDDERDISPRNRFDTGDERIPSDKLEVVIGDSPTLTKNLGVIIWRPRLSNLVGVSRINMW